MAAAAPIAPFALAGAQAGASLLSARSHLSQSRDMAQQQQGQAYAAETRAQEIAATRRDELSRLLSAFDVARGANNVEATSPTGMAIREDLRKYARRDARIEVSNVRQMRDELIQGSRATLAAGRTKAFQSGVNAVESLASVAQMMVG